MTAAAATNEPAMTANAAGKPAAVTTQPITAVHSDPMPNEMAKNARTPSARSRGG